MTAERVKPEKPNIWGIPFQALLLLDNLDCVANTRTTTTFAASHWGIVPGPSLTSGVSYCISSIIQVAYHRHQDYYIIMQC